MAQIAENGLEARLDELTSQVRSLTAGNWTNRASVVNAAGKTVPLSALAFGQVAARDNALIRLTTNDNTLWVQAPPTVDVYVTGGSLRVDLTAGVSLGSNGQSIRGSACYGLTGPTPTPGPGGAVVQAPDISHGLQVTWAAAATSSSDTTHFGNFLVGVTDFVENLPPGWYRVQTYLRLAWEGTVVAAGNAAFDYRRLIVAPY